MEFNLATWLRMIKFTELETPPWFCTFASTGFKFQHYYAFKKPPTPISSHLVSCLYLKLQQLSVRTERSFVEMRQLKICATCFDISVGLLRVLEMVVNVASNIFLDAENPSAEILLGRLYQVSFLSQVLKLCIF